MVMPCSRSASRPSVRSERSMPSWPRFCDARATAASWSSNTARVSCKRRPISVLFPSSTLPAVMKRRTPRSSANGDSRSILSGCAISEIPLLLAPLHGDLGSPIVHAGRPALGHLGQNRLGDDLGGGSGQRFDRTGARDVTDRAEAHREFLHFFAFARRSDAGHGNEQPAPADDGPAVRVVDRGDVELLALDVLPD